MLTLPRRKVIFSVDTSKEKRCWKKKHEKNLKTTTSKSTSPWCPFYSYSLSSMLNEYTLIYVSFAEIFSSGSPFSLLINCGRIFSTCPTKRVVPTIHRPRVKIHQRRINIVEVCGCQRQLLCELYIFLEINSKCFLYKWGGEYFFNWIRNNTFKLQRMNLKRSWQQGQSTLYSTP